MNRTVVFQAQQGTLLQAQTMLLDEPNERLYVGAKNRLLSLVLCPQDRLFSLAEESVESGRGRSPYDPSSPCTSTLYKPKFIKSAVISDNDDPEDDKVYFFFTEREQNPEGETKAVYTRVGRVCATRLICSVAGANGIDTHFDELEDVFVLKNKDGKNPEIFGLFSTTSAVFKGYAVCVYQMEDIRASFNGPFAQRERPGHHWTPYEDRVPYPRPGSCASKMSGGGFSSSKEFPDEVLRFVRAHPVMYRAVQPLHRRPVLLQTEGGGRKLTQLAMVSCIYLSSHFSDDSMVLKVITIYNKDTDTVEEVLLEELQVFQVPTTITEIIISSKKQQLYVGSELGVAQVRLHQCELYGSQCADCCLARDPYCAWDGLTCSRYYPAGVYPKSRRFRRQDVRHGNAVQLCNGLQIDDQQHGLAEERWVYGVETNSTLLECTPRSLQARVLWFRQQGEEQHELQASERVVPTTHGLLLLRLRSSDAGVYVCQTAEHGYVHALLRVTLVVLTGERVGAAADGDGEKAAAAACPSSSSSSSSGPPRAAASAAVPPPGPHSRVWYKEFLQLIGYGDAQRVEEYCER
ncbi:hypothetical protein CRUP_032527, partial [Coryphaenoides rupestris]